EPALELTGYTRAELIGNKVPLLFDDPVAASKSLIQALDRGRAQAEFSLLTKNTTEITVSLYSSAFKSLEGTVGRIVMAMRHPREDRRAQSINLLAASVLEASAQAIFGINSPELKINYWNPGAEKLLGYTTGEAVGRNINVLLPLERRAELAERFQRLCQGS